MIPHRHELSGNRMSDGLDFGGMLPGADDQSLWITCTCSMLRSYRAFCNAVAPISIA